MCSMISGQMNGSSDKKLSENFGKIVQDTESKNIDSSDISISKSTQRNGGILEFYSQ